MSGLESRIAGLSPAKRDLLLQRLRQQQEEARDDALTPRWTPDDREPSAPFPLAGIQQAYWAGRSGLFDLGTQGANGYFELHFSGLDEQGVARLNAAFRALIERHPMLRAVILPDGQQQILERVPPFEFQTIDLRQVEPGEAERRLMALRQELRTRRSPLDRWPLFDFVASFLADDEVRLQIRFELVVLDGVTRFILFREWFQLFRDPGSELPPLECTYRDFIRTWADFRSSSGFSRSREYWLARLPQMPPAPELPLERKADPLTPSVFVNHVEQTLEVEGWSRLKSHASRRGLTPTAVVLAAFVDVLSGWSRVPEFSFPVLGTFNPPIHPQIDRIVGNFNSLTMLAITDRTGDFEARARRLQDQVTAALDHQAFSGFEVLREINRRRGATSNLAMPVLFDSLLELGHQRYGYLHSEGLGEGIRPRYVDHAGMYVPQFHLIAMVAQFNGSLSSRWQAVEHLYPEGFIQQMAEAYSHLLRRLAEDEEAWRADWAQTLRMLFNRPGAGPLARWCSEEEPVDLRASTFLEVNRLLGLGAGSRVLASAPAGSEAAAWEVSGTLAAGAALLRPAPEIAGDPAALACYIAQEHPTAWSADPFLVEEVLAWLEDEGAAGGLESLERILLSGNRVPVNLPERLKNLAGGAEVLLVGGPCWSCWQALGEVPTAWTGNLVGHPFPHLDLQVLSPALEPCPVWVEGEICLGRGENFLRSGEQGRLRDSGRLEWLGRREAEETRILGYRVVLREVAACLERHRGVRVAVVAGRPGPDGKSRLCAWVVRRSRPETTAEELQDFLEERLPYYMVPSEFVFVAALPRDACGRIDLEALPPPPGAERAGGAMGREDGLEPLLVQIWREVLGRDSVGVTDDFYSLGGDSLALVRMAARVREQFGEDLPLWKFFREPTVRGLADLIRTARKQ